MLVSGFYLLLVACCPASCPSKACRSEEDEYTRCELGWPTVLAVVLCLVVFCTAIPSMVKTTAVVDSFNYVGCQSMLLLDHTINGRLGNDSLTFFAGLQLINRSAVTMQAQLSTYSNNGQTALGNANALLATGNAGISAIQNLYTSYSDISYSNAFRDSSLAYLASVPSQFKNLFLGPSSAPASVTGLLLAMFQPITANVSAVVTPMLAALASIKAGVDSATMDSRFRAAVLGMAAFNQTMAGFMAKAQAFFSTNDGLAGVKYGLIAFYILLILNALVGIAALLAIFLCGLFEFRKFAYCALGFFMVLGIVGCLLAAGFGLLIPTLYFGCNNLETALSNSTFLNQSLVSLGLNWEAASAVSTIVGQGDFLGRLAPAFAVDYMNFKTLFDNSILFENRTSLYSASSISAANTSANTIINNVYENFNYDVNDTGALAWLSSMASGGVSTSSTCNSNAQSDSWVPSFTNPSPDCRSGVLKRTLCNDISSTAVCPVGCYPFTQELSNLTSGDSNPSLWLTRLRTRYNLASAPPDCNYVTYVSDIKNQWDNPRQNNLNALRNTMNQAGNVNPTLQDYVSQMGVLRGTVRTYATSLDNTIPSVVNSTSGVMAGLNSTVLRVDLANLHSGACYLLLPEAFFLFASLLVISACLLAADALLVCAVYRHGRIYKVMVEQAMKIHPVLEDEPNQSSHQLFE
jgi:hypothetical protein